MYRLVFLFVLWTSTAFGANISFKTGGESQFSLGDTQNTCYDKLLVQPRTFSLDLIPDVPQVAVVNTYTFDVGYNAVVSSVNTYDSARELEIKMAEKTFYAHITQLFTVGINTSDTIHFLQGNTLAINLGSGILNITPLEAPALTISNGLSARQDLTAQFCYVSIPEPSSLGLLGLGTAGLLLRKRKKL